MATLYSRARPPSKSTLRVTALLRRYPDLSARELAELIDRYPTLTILDQVLMTADGRVARKLIAFDRDHGKRLRSRLSSLILFVSLPLTIAIIGAWLALA